MGQVVTRLDEIDEFDFFCKAAKSANLEYVQFLVTNGL